jgi:acetyl/propionyl-CoA carboxylase alpha subunit
MRRSQNAWCAKRTQAIYPRGSVVFSKILIANRGEIACRVIRTARALGYRTVAVYSDADATAPHVHQADEAVRLGPAPASDSYLLIDAVTVAARASGADAVHPGYGFLSERADFARACAETGLVFIGPPAAAIDAMGDKAQAKRRMLEAGVPCVPGYLGDAQDDERLQREATSLGWPLLVKAVAGGGGRGMRLVRAAHELPSALAGARREADSAFGDGRLMLERLVERGRHVEVQVFADAHGHAIHLGERDCTAQRRRQKLIEETPSPIISTRQREAMGRDAVAAAQAVGYVGAGTVEFIVDAEGRHFFLEMNTRLQVEHPVTEFVTGLDLVEWQLRVAAGEPLPLEQHEVRFSGHAIEARLCAEDPYDGFTPQTGRILHWQPAAALAAANLAGRAPALRIDDGIAEGGEIGPHYDAMVAKLVVHGRDRDDAIRRLAAALEDAPLVGPRSNGRFLRDLLRHDAFRRAALHTSLIDEWAAGSDPLLHRPQADDAAWLAAALLRAGDAAPALRPTSVSSWGLALQCGERVRTLRVAPSRDGTDGTVKLTLDGREHVLRLVAREGAVVRIEQDGVQRRWHAVHEPAQGAAPAALHLLREAAHFRFHEPSPLPASASADDPRRAFAPVAGLVAQLLVKPGDHVAAGQPLMSIEAMKMEMWLNAGAAGTVAAVHASPRDAVRAGALLVELTLEPKT